MAGSVPMGRMKVPARVLALAAAYLAAGWIMRPMAMPPGFACAVWPAAGVALAGLLLLGPRYWPAVALGAFAVDLPVALATAHDTRAAVLLATGLGAVAAAQAVLGVLLVRPLLRAPSAYTHGLRIAGVLLLAGPVACMAGAGAAVGLLHQGGLIAPADSWLTWLTWWVGDSVGVMTMLPVMVAWRSPTGPRSARHRAVASVPMLAVLALVGLLVMRTDALERQRIERHFEQRAWRVTQALNRQFAEYTEALQALASFQSATEAPLQRAQFHRMVADMLARHPGLLALSWSPLVPDRERGAYERRIRAEGFPDAGIREFGPGRSLRAAARRDRYVPITFIEPIERNRAALGFDLGSNNARRATLRAALEHDRPAASPELELVQGSAGPSGVIVVAPAYWPDRPRGTRAQRREALRGYVSAVLRMNEMMAVFVRRHDMQRLNMRVFDPDADGPAARPIYATAAAASDPARASDRPPPLSTPLSLAGRQWRLEFSAAPGYPATYRSDLVRDALLLALLLTWLLGTLQLLIVGRTGAIEFQVRRRTGELAAANAALRTSETAARAVIDTARDAYIAIDVAGNITDWNGEAERLLGWSRTEVIGRKASGLLVPDACRDAHEQGLRRYLATGESHIIDRRIEVDVRRRDGHLFPAELIVWTTPDDTTPRFHAFLHDISGRRRALQRLSAQQAAASALLESASLAEAAPRILREVCSALGWSMGTLWMFDEATQSLRCCELWRSRPEAYRQFDAATRALRLAPGDGLPGRVWETAAPQWIEDVAQAPSLPRAQVAQQEGIHAAFAVPVPSSGEMIGVLEFFADRPEVPDAGLLSMMDVLGNLLGQFIARKRTESALFEEKDRAAVMLESIGDGVIATDTEGLVTFLNPVAEAMTGWSLQDARGRAVTEVLPLAAPGAVPAAHPLLAAVREDRTLELPAATELVRRDGFRSPIEDSTAPIHDRDGRVTGAVMAFHDVSQTQAMALKMAHLAQHDYLTGLPNRVLLQDRFMQGIERARREHHQLALLYTDLDGFKHINDSLGHEVGDQLLREVARRLLDSVRGVDTVSRQGGDEFVILLPDIHGSEDAAQVATNVLEAMRAPFRIGTSELNVSLSVGISLYPGDGDTPGALLKYADAAMYQAKQHGRDRFRFYTRAISERADRRLHIESSLHRALRNGEFEVHYQPKVASDSGMLTGMEALVRWHAPSETPCPTATFIEVAEECGLVARIDQWVLEEACRQNHAWQQAGLDPVPVAVNLSLSHVNVEHYHETIARVLSHTGLSPCWLQIEITEGQMLYDTERFDTLIRGIKAAGVKVAIDDFGTGYSSLGYLRRFAFDVLKIDRSFVQSLETDATAAAIVEAITRLAHSLGYAVVAEGVETLEQARILQAHGCHEMQGYLYSHPVPATQFEALLRANRIAPGLDA